MKRVVVCALIAVGLIIGSAGSAKAHYVKQSAVQQYKHAQDVLRFFTNHPLLARTPAGKVAIKNHRWLLEEARRRLAPIYPPHHALWVCIASFEGSWSDTSSPYTGGLQMHLNWYGVSNAGYLSQAQQEWAAEKAWKANGYSWSFLNDQWFKWDAADGCYS